MPLIAKDSGDFLICSPGMHLARCYRIVDKGTQKGEYKGEVTYKPKVMLQFEVHGEDENGKPLQTADGRPLSLSKSYNLTLAEKSTLRKDLQMWRGREFTAQELRGFELKNVLGAWAMLTVTHSESGGKTYANIDAINPVPVSMKKAGLPEGVNDVKIFDIESPDMEMFDGFSENLKSQIQSSPEWQERHGKPEIVNSGGSAMAGINTLDDDVPF